MAISGRRFNMGIPVTQAVPVFQTYPPADRTTIQAGLSKIEGLAVVPYRINWKGFKQYLEDSEYPVTYRDDFGSLYFEKALEHYVSVDLLRLRAEDVFMDIACASSPFADIVSRRFGCTVYRQDLDYPPGIHGSIVGGSAGNLPFPPNSISKMTLHCSLEHFEGDADMEFMRECERTLTPGGAVCVLPLYMAEVFTNVTDPEVDRTGLMFDDCAKIAEVRGWRNRFGRHYDLQAFTTRILGNIGSLKPRIFAMENERDFCDSCYLKFALVLTRE